MRKILFAALILGAAPAYAQDSNEEKAGIGGARIEIRTGVESLDLSQVVSITTTKVASLGTGFVYGGEIGYDIPVSDSMTVGPYIGIDGGGTNMCETYTFVGGTGEMCLKGKSNISGGARVAWATRKTEFYLGLGYSSYSLDFTIKERNLANTQVLNYANQKARGGLELGLGFNFNVARNAYIGVGTKLGGFGEFEGSGYDLQRFQGHAALGLRF